MKTIIQLLLFIKSLLKMQQSLQTQAIRVKKDNY